MTNGIISLSNNFIFVVFSEILICFFATLLAFFVDVGEPFVS